MTAQGSYYDVPAGLGGVRVLAGLGCGCSAEDPSNGVGALPELMKNPIVIGVGLAVLVGVVILIRESVR